MPCEYASFFLKPANFFDVNPGINLPAIRDAASTQVRPLVASSILKPDLVCSPYDVLLRRRSIVELLYVSQREVRQLGWYKP
jgi:hypothetical protein